MSQFFEALMDKFQFIQLSSFRIVTVLNRVAILKEA